MDPCIQVIYNMPYTGKYCTCGFETAKFKENLTRKKWCFGSKLSTVVSLFISCNILATVIVPLSSLRLLILQVPAQQVMMPLSSQSSSPPQQQQQPENSSALQSSSLTQTGSQLLQVTCLIMSNLHDHTTLFVGFLFLFLISLLFL